MKILEYGHIKPKEVKCSHCGAILEFCNIDLTYMSGKYYIYCPVCGKIIKADNNGVPFKKEEINNA